MGKRYDLLAKNFVNIGDRYQNDEEIILDHEGGMKKQKKQ